MTSQRLDGEAQAVGSASEWEHLAPWWKDAFTDGADLEYEREILPLVAEELGHCAAVLDIGCGEGQVARLLAAAPGRPVVVGLDPTAAQLANARQAETGKVQYVRGAGEALPFADRSFAGVLCCLAIEHARDPDALLAEAARVLADGGRFLLLVNHPLYQGAGSGLIDDLILGEHYWRVGPYLRESVNLEEVDNGVLVAFAHRPLSRYLNPLAERGCYLTKMHEPPPRPEFLAASVDPELEGAIPRLLAMRFERIG